MPLILTDEQTMLKEAADGFLNERAPIKHFRELRDRKAAARDVDSLRRNLQREHLKRLAAGLLRPIAASGNADAPAVNRMVARQIESDLRVALAAGGWSGMARAHLEDSLALISEALRAPLNKQGV